LLPLLRVLLPGYKDLKPPEELGVEEEVRKFTGEVFRWLPYPLLRVLWGLLGLLGLLLEKLPPSLLQELNRRSPPFRTLLSLIKTMVVLPYASRPEIREVLGTNVERGKPRVPCPPLVRENLVEFQRSAGRVEIECDVLVVGAGAGGAVVAKELAEKGLRVAVVERGFEHDAGEFTGEPREMIPLLYRNSGSLFAFPLPPLPGPPIMLPVGNCLGGTTVINSSTCFRTPDELLERWTEWGLEGLSPAEMRPYFERVERLLSVRPVSLELMGEAHARVAEGARKLGYRGMPLEKNARGCDATGVCQYGCPIDAKRDMRLTYLPLATQAGARIYTGFEVQQIEVRGRRVVKAGGVIYNRRGEKVGRFVVRARVYVLAAGALYTPVLLLANRLANSSGMVGQNLRIHPCVFVAGFFPESLYGWRTVSQSYGIDFRERGFVLESTTVPPSIGALSTPFVGKELMEVMEEWRKVGSIGVMVDDSDSVGRVLPLLPLPYGLPKLGMEALVLYRLGRRDTRAAQEGTVEACRILLEGGAERVCTGLARMPWVRRGKDLERLAELKVLATDFIWSAYHPQGTCRMSPDPRTGVVDSYGRCHDLENLYVADASIFPECVRVNPQISIMAFATRCADHLWEGWRE
ncbi:MAG: GMC family oxidoreductase, partial [Candidatus Hadarchaeales archaeon]